MTVVAIVTGSSPGNATVVPVVVFESSATNDQIFQVTVNGTGQIKAIVNISGSPDGINFTPMGQIVAQGVGQIIHRQRIVSSFRYWTSSTMFCTPGATADVTIQY